jgi:glycosyltransferase involved in cell wall biosynthesis
MSDLSKLRITYVAGTLGQGGAERQLFYAVEALRQSGAAVQVLSLDQGGFWEKPIKELGAAVTWIGQDRSRFKRVFRIAKHLKQQPVDILQSQHFYTNAYASLAALFLNCKAIGALRSNGHFEVTESGRIGGRINLQLPKILAANSQSSIQYAIRRGISRSRLFFLPNVVDTDRFKPGGAAKGPITLLTVGRLTREKRFDRFISLIHRLRTERGLDVRGWIVGPTRADQELRPVLEEQATAFGLLSDKLQFLGSVADMVPIYQQGTIFVLTSDHEGTPNVLLEAMATGLPIVATDVGGVPEVVRHQRTGFLVPCEDTKAQLDAVSQLVEDPGLRTEMGTRARAYVEEVHSLHRLPAHLADLYDLALGKPATQRSETHSFSAPARNGASTPILHVGFRNAQLTTKRKL